MMASMTMSQSARSCMLVVPLSRACAAVFCSAVDAALFDAALDQARQRLLDAGKTFVEKFLLLLENHDVEARRGRDLRDARAHQSTTEYANFLDFHEYPNQYPAPRGLKSARQIERKTTFRHG